MSKATPEPGGPRFAHCKHCHEMIVKYPGGPWYHTDGDQEGC